MADAPELPEDRDENRERLLDAAARVFARKGYEGSKIMDIVRESGLSTGAVYGRFTSKNDLLRQAVVGRAALVAEMEVTEGRRVVDMIFEAAMDQDRPLSVNEAVRLEAYVAARREPEVAQAIQEAQDAFRASVQPFIESAVADGTLAPDVDPEAVLFLLRTIQLGLLVGRAAGITPPPGRVWEDLILRVLGSVGDRDPALPTLGPHEHPDRS